MIIYKYLNLLINKYDTEIKKSDRREHRHPEPLYFCCLSFLSFSVPFLAQIWRWLNVPFNFGPIRAVVIC